MSKNMGVKPRKVPSQERSKMTVDAIYEAAMLLYSHEGPQAITTERIAERAGVSIGTLYQYFPNKESILVGMWENFLDSVSTQCSASAVVTPLPGKDLAIPPPLPDTIPPLEGEAIPMMEGLPGLYTGTLKGHASGAFLHLKHGFDFDAVWEFDVNMEHLNLAIREIPVLGEIVGQGPVDPESGYTTMVFTVPILKKVKGSGIVDRERSFSFSIPRVGFSLSGQLGEDGRVAGHWKFDFSMIVFHGEAKGDMAGKLAIPYYDSVKDAANYG